MSGDGDRLNVGGWVAVWRSQTACDARPIARLLLSLGIVAGLVKRASTLSHKSHDYLSRGPQPARRPGFVCRTSIVAPRKLKHAARCRLRLSHHL